MENKRCLFCEQFVPITRHGDELRFRNCYCAPEGYYRIRQDYYDNNQEAGYREKTELFPQLSGYIRERSEANEEVSLSDETVEKILNSQQIPVTIEEKANRLLRYLYSQTDAPGTPVLIHRLSVQFNLTYWPNLQEFVYIIEQLKEQGMIERTGSSFLLTGQGWQEAASSGRDTSRKRCTLLLPHDEQLREAWEQDLVPVIDKLGYTPFLLPWNNEESDPEEQEDAVSFIEGSQLVIADLTGQAPDVMYAAGYALGIRIPVIWTVQQNKAAELVIPSYKIRPMLWDDTPELAAKLQQKLAAAASRA
ncbi:hypothetical protein FHS18_003653 [Paenibacillus phyllosphaerae]|uniref:Nucleoside 2-deoxyribosyltransferase n=1 Tax=Paenibacillus phyllosphaerae TaxID=274593 RepID=A0A7W5AZE2_9BACL|nr:hypothetical protein [Paenibacillus phyllosphaerae]MBB3111585.1 hypothetical protein [Paenibacillus phyllosphaerae]